MRVYYDRDADLNLIKGKKVAIIAMEARATRTRSICVIAA
jgi:ketol-acid reductoisomerase